MVFKLLCAASKTWRWPQGKIVAEVIAGVRFENGIEVINGDQQTTPPDRLVT